MPIIDHADCPELEMRPGIKGQFLANRDLGSSAVSLLTNTVEPGAEAPLHVHTVEETMLVLEGTIWARVGDERYTVGKNHTVVIPPYTPHAWGNGVLFAASIHLAMATPNCHILEVSQAYMPMLYELFQENFDIRDGRVYAPQKPGLGFTLRGDALDRFRFVPGPEFEW